MNYDFVIVIRTDSTTCFTYKILLFIFKAPYILCYVNKVSYTTLIVKIDKCLSVALLIAETAELFVLIHFHMLKQF